LELGPSANILSEEQLQLVFWAVEAGEVASGLAGAREAEATGFAAWWIVRTSVDEARGIMDRRGER